MKHMMSLKTTAGPDSSLKKFPLLYLYFDNFAEIVEAWQEGCLEAAIHDCDIRSKNITLNQAMKDEVLFLYLYENNLLRLRINNDSELFRKEEEEYWDMVIHPEKHSGDLRITNPQFTPKMKKDLTREYNRLTGVINSTVEAIKQRYNLAR